MANHISFEPKQLSAVLLGAVPARAQDVLQKRFGLGKGQERMTLDAIGKTTALRANAYAKLRILHLIISANQMYTMMRWHTLPNCAPA